ncbi:MAG: dTDP-4-dehydrorhamnose 3,5-epimerase [Synergistaceae bacterium]|jgi:dTDP-4-dehydrorhamnose 3,5-epimerase|nr:dTDP-4-dehydrorhamnose 3,5-epimerase [Synergistaceae bacterium]
MNNNFAAERAPLDGLLLIKTRVFGDGRGYFMEVYNRRSFGELGVGAAFVQCNRSRSRRGTLRGLHFQKCHPQGKLVSVSRGEVFDVAVDLRKSSPSFGKWFGVSLREDDGTMFYVPPGFAHGFYVVSEIADFSYLCTDFYEPEDEAGLLWNDPDVGINWPIENGGDVIVSDKDGANPTLGGCFVYP